MIRAFCSGLRVHLVLLSRSPFDVVGMLVWPIVFASIAYLLIGTDSTNSVLLTASLGAAVMIMWSQVIVGSGFALDNQRVQGTLELLVAAPTPLVALLSPFMVGGALFGIYGLVVTLLWGRLLFGIGIDIGDWPGFLIAIGAGTAAMGLLGLIATSVLVLHRGAMSFSVALQYPMFIACGLIIPFAVLPDWVRPISWVLAPTWAYRGAVHAATGGSPWPDIGMCVLLSACYLVLAVPCVALVEGKARRGATLHLA